MDWKQGTPDVAALLQGWSAPKLVFVGLIAILYLIIVCLSQNRGDNDQELTMS
jgi:hypothetical protein